ncbi:VanW family protein [Candidatus Woesebacteria bacterium]|nr:VanW family protein [Candidatus Woesebacteria bacterium]
MPKIRIKLKSRWTKKLVKKAKTFLPFLVKVFVGVNIAFAAYNLIFIGRILPNVSVAGVDISGLTPAEANRVLAQKITLPIKLTLVDGGEKFDLDLASIDLRYDLEQTSYSAYNLFRTGNLVFDAANRIEALWKKRNLGIRFTYDETRLQETISVIAGQTAVEPIYPSVTLEAGKVVVNPGKAGFDVDLGTLKADVSRALAFAKLEPVLIKTTVVDSTLTPSQQEEAQKRAEKLVDKKLSLTFEFETFTYSETDIFALINPSGGYKEEKIAGLSQSLASSVERSPQNPKFVFEEGRVKDFAPSKPGVAIDSEKFKTSLTEKLKILETTEEKLASFEIPVKLTEPEVATSEVNNLGIKELLGRGSSRFRGSITSRVYNIDLAATRLNGVLIAPGETVSFNEKLGDVSKLTGYKEAYVIKDGKTVLGDGGGVCQVSTTLFRAVLNAGLPIVERRAHAYRVGYYEQDSGPGLDATVYSPTTDFKFINDTPAHILIQAYPDTKNLTLVFELYGTSDGRKASITKPVTSGVTPPPEDLYVDDPTLPTGVIKQIEHKAWGAKSVFNYTVERDGQIIYEKTFISNYRPWQAVYLRGTGPAQ